MNDEQLRANTIGDRKPLNDTIRLVPYDLAWPTQFARYANEIVEALGDKVVRIEHVGSTSIPGISAKPIVDLVLVVEDSSDEPAYVAALEARGFVLRIREPDWFEHRLLKAPGDAGNVHVFSRGCEEVDRMLAFRDWLRTHADDRERYERAKLELAARVWRHTQDYADAKSDVVREILARALADRS